LQTSGVGPPTVETSTSGPGAASPATEAGPPTTGTGLSTTVQELVHHLHQYTSTSYRAASPPAAVLVVGGFIYSEGGLRCAFDEEAVPVAGVDLLVAGGDFFKGTIAWDFFV
jgi:hypothetical protein